MVTYKDNKPKPQVAKRMIKVDCVSIEDGVFKDEDGNIAQRVADALPQGVDEFVLKIQTVLNEE